MKRLPRILVLGVMSYALAALVGCSAFSGSPSNARVTISKSTFSPSPVVVRVGGTVTWSNEESSTGAHNVTATDGSFDSGAIQKGSTFTQTFESPGTVNYFSRYSPSMTGTVIVR
jgi:plastocyanin